MKYRIQDRRTKAWLASPQMFGDGDQLWPWLHGEDKAHHFNSRGEAKAALLDLDPRFKRRSGRESVKIERVP